MACKTMALKHKIMIAFIFSSLLLMFFNSVEFSVGFSLPSIREGHFVPSESVLESERKIETVTELFDRVGLVGPCRQRIADSIIGENGCWNIFDTPEELQTWQSLFALEITNCHLESHRKATYTSCTEYDPYSCIKQMKDTDFQIFTQFSIEVERICSELSHERWQRSVEILVSKLHEEATFGFQTVSKIAEKASIIQEGQLELGKSIESSTSYLKNFIEGNIRILNKELVMSLDATKQILSLQEQSRGEFGKALAQIRNDTDEVKASMKDQILKEIKAIDAVTTALAIKFSQNNDILSQYSTLVQDIKSTVDALITEFSPIWRTINKTTGNMYLNMYQAKSAAFHLLFFVAFRTFVSFRVLSSIRPFLYLVYAVEITLEYLVLPNFLSGEQTMFQLYWNLRGIFACIGLMILLTGTANALLNRDRYISRKEALCLLGKIQECIKTRNNEDLYLVKCLICQIVQYRSELEKHNVALDLNSQLVALLASPPKHYREVKNDDSALPKAIFEQTHEERMLECENVKKVEFAPPDYGYDTHSSIEPIH